MMSRSFGDQVGHKVGMTAIPGRLSLFKEVKIFRKEPSVKVLIVGTDGLWEKISEASIVNFVRKNYKESNAAEKICKELVHNSTNRWNKVRFFKCRNAYSIAMTYPVYQLS